VIKSSTVGAVEEDWDGIVAKHHHMGTCQTIQPNPKQSLTKAQKQNSLATLCWEIAYVSCLTRLPAVRWLSLLEIDEKLRRHR